MRLLRYLLLIVFSHSLVLAQDLSRSPNLPAPSDYILGPGDQVALVVPALADDFNGKTFRIDGRGDVSLPVAGSVHAGGKTIPEFQDQVKYGLREILQTPDVVVNLTEYASQPVSVLGAVGSPGIRQLQGNKSLFEVLSIAGGLRADCGTTIEVTRNLSRGPIPLPDATVSTTGATSIAVVKVKNIMNASAENISVLPGDTIFVPRASVVYAVGSVNKPGGYTIGEDDALSALQVVSLAGGLVKAAAGDKAKILRKVPGSQDRTEIPVNINRLMSGRATDLPLQANDILFVPNSGAKSAAFRTADAIVAFATGLAIYGGGHL